MSRLLCRVSRVAYVVNPDILGSTKETGDATGDWIGF